MRWFWELDEDKRVAVWGALCVAAAALALLWAPLITLTAALIVIVVWGASR